MSYVCEKCGLDFDSVPYNPFPFCKGSQDDHKPGSYGVQGDECDVMMKHGLCNPDGSPKHYTSKAAIKRDAEAAGLTNVVRHIGRPGSDKSPHTTRWY